MRHLAAGVDPGVGPAGHGQRGRLWQPEHPAERFGQGLLYGALPGLAGPAGKARAVVADVDPEPDQAVPGPVA
jgi:hypothetical protein